MVEASCLRQIPMRKCRLQLKKEKRKKVALRIQLLRSGVFGVVVVVVNPFGKGQNQNFSHVNLGFESRLWYSKDKGYSQTFRREE